MAMSKHTPGPWTIRDYKTKTGGVWIDGGFVRNRSCGTVAEVYPLTHQDGNIHLLVAAPETYASLKAMTDWVRAALQCKTWDWDGDQREAAELELAAAMSAIAKAEGRS